MKMWYLSHEVQNQKTPFSKISVQANATTFFTNYTQLLKSHLYTLLLKPLCKSKSKRERPRTSQTKISMIKFKMNSQALTSHLRILFNDKDPILDFLFTQTPMLSRKQKTRKLAVTTTLLRRKVDFQCTKLKTCRNRCL